MIHFLKDISFVSLISGGLLVGSSVLMISVRNPVYSVLLLVMVFVSAALLLLSVEIDFLALVLLLVYVGAIAVLFLFIVMMLDLKTTPAVLGGTSQYGPLALTLSLVLVVQSSIAIYNTVGGKVHTEAPLWCDFVDNVNSLASLGQVLYTDFIGFFLIAGLVLLVAMAGAILLTRTTNV